MPESSPAQHRAGIARASRRVKREPDNLDARRDLESARQEYRLASIEEFIARALADAPPLTPDQRARLAGLLAPRQAAS